MDTLSVRVALMLHGIPLRFVLPVEITIFMSFRTSKMIEKTFVYLLFKQGERLSVAG